MKKKARVKLPTGPQSAVMLDAKAPEPPPLLGTSSLTFYGSQVTAGALTRTLAGPLVRFGVLGNTSAGKLQVKRPDALRFPSDLGRVKLTKEHVRGESRGHLIQLEITPDGIRAACKVADGPEGDAALREAQDRTRDGFSFDVINAQIVGDEIVSADVIAIGQVGIPAYADSVIDTVAAATPETPGAQQPGTTEGNSMTQEQRARLALLRANTARTAEEETELATLAALETAEAAAPPAEAAAPPAAVAASLPALPPGVPTPTIVVNEPAAGSAFTRLCETVAAAMAPGARDITAITAALADITNTAHTGDIEAPAWSGELWSGLRYEPEFLDLFSAGTLDHWKGDGWRFTSKLEMSDYAGDKTEIPTSTIGTEPSSYEAARMAVGVDIDRKFFDFPNTQFVKSLFEQARESWQIKLDAKVRAYALAKAVAVTGPAGTQPTLLKAAAKASQALKRRRVGRASWVMVNDDDMFTLLDYAEKDVPVFLSLYGIAPENFRSSPDIAAGTVLAGVKQAATLRTLPGSPLRVEAQNLTRAGIDEAFFGYWAIEEHHKSGIAKTTFTKP